MTDAPALRYPILIACIGQDRAPLPDEIDRVAHRILREGFGDHDGATAQRLAVGVARLALLGGRASR